jgi:hypothetical protein
LQAIGEFDCEIGALAQLVPGICVLFARSAHLFECLKQSVEVLGKKLPAESGIVARPC